MRSTLFRTDLLVLILTLSAIPFGSHVASQRARASTRELQVSVDRRVEVLSILQALAGGREYTNGPATPYRSAMVAHFRPFLAHPAVAATRALRQRGVVYEAPMHLAGYLGRDLRALRPLTPRLPGLARFEGVDLVAYVDLVRRFAADTALDAFLSAQAAQVRGVEQRFRDFLRGSAFVGWFDAVFGRRRGATYRLVPGMTTGLMSYGGFAVRTNGAQDVMIVVSLDDVDGGGLPQPGDLARGLIVHELAHTYVNPMMDHALATLTPVAEPVIAPSAAAMRQQAYTTTKTVIEESVVRALVVMFMRDQVDGAHAAAQLHDEESRGFVWTADLVDALTTARAAHAGRLTLATLVEAVRTGFAMFASRGARP